MTSRLLVTLLFTGLLLHASLATASLGVRVAERLYRILTNEEDSVEVRLEKLAELAANRAYSVEDRAYVALLVQEERAEEARQELEAVLADEPEDFFPPMRLALARTLLILDEIDAALTQFETWRRVEREPDPQALFLLGFAYLRTGQYQKCIDVLEPLVQNNSEARSNWVELLAFAYAQSGRSDDAIALMLGLIDRFPTRSPAWKSLSGFYQMTDDVDHASGSLATARELEALKVSEASHLARMYGFLGMPDDGATLLEQTLNESAESESYSNLMLLARLHLQARNFEDAVRALNLAGESGDDGEPYVFLGQLYLHWERYTEAVNALKNAIRIFGEEAPADVYYLLAVAAINQEEPAIARDALQQIEADEQYRDRVKSLRSFLTD